MQDPQSATWHFLAPVAVAYLAACGGWLCYDRMRGLTRGQRPRDESNRPWLDFALAIAAAAGIFALGEVYRRGWLLPTGNDWRGRLGWTVDNLIIFSPIAAVLVLRRQGVDTLFLSAYRLPEKIVLGVVLGVASLSTYSAMRGEIDQIGPRLAASVEPEKLVDFLPVFLEGVALAFGFVRFRWLVGTAAALVVPAMLFAAAHVPGQVANDRTLVYMAVFFAFNSTLAAAILWTVARSRDVVWIGIVHYLMDVAIEAV
jgi:hypothetical protein